MIEDGQVRQPSGVLAVQLKDGSEQAARLLFQRFGPWLRKEIDRRIGVRLQQRVDAEDIMQSAFWSFFRRTAAGEYTFDHSGALCRLLLTIATHKIHKTVDRNRSARRDVRRELPGDVTDFHLAGHDWQRETHELVDALDEITLVVDRLEPRDAEFFRRRYFVGQKPALIAAETGWSLATVKRVLRRVTDQVQKCVQSRIGD